MARRYWLLLPLAIAVAACSGGGGDSVLPGVQAMVFVKRAFVQGDLTHNVSGGNRQTIDYLRYTPGGGLYVLTPPTPAGTLTNLTAGFEDVDVNGIDVSFDGLQVAFSMRRSGDDHYHVYITNIDQSGETRQLTFGDYDDVSPIFVPGDRIAFLTNQPYTPMGTRADEYEHAREVAQLGTISISNGDADRRVCSQNLSHSAEPFLMADGRIGFSRWEHFASTNDVKLFAMKPDCTGMVAVAGQHGKPGNSLVQVSEIGEGRFVGVVTSRSRTIQSGSLYLIDAQNHGGSSQIALDEQNAQFTALTPDVPVDETAPASGVGRYRQPMGLPGTDDLVVSWANGEVNDRNELAATAPNFGIYRLNTHSGRRTLVYDDPNTWDLYAMPVRVREVPPAEPGVVGPAPDPNTPATLGSVDVRQTSLEENVTGGTLDGMSLSEALQHTKHVRVIEGFSSEIGPIREFGLTMHEGAAIMGEVPVQSDGSWEASVPPYLPYHFQALDEFGMAIRNEALWVQAMPGESRRCGGCHESRNDTVLPMFPNGTLAQQLGTIGPTNPQNLVKPIADRMELPWSGAANAAENVQELLNDRCASCHDGGPIDQFASRSYMVEVTNDAGVATTFTIPYLRLSDDPIMVSYEDEVVTYPMGYVTLLYPSAMMGDSVATGDVPPMWVIPGAARESALIAAINIDDGTNTNWAFPEGVHHVNGELTGLTHEERMMLVRMADLGGQYWSRRNVQGSIDWLNY